MNPRIATSCACLVLAASAFAQEPQAPEKDVVLQALEDELARSMTLQIADLDQPYFMQFIVSDVVTHSVDASYGAIVETDDDRMRVFSSQVRVGTQDLDSTNFGGGGGGRGRGGGMGGRALLPIDDDYTAIRQAIWLAVDGAFKSAVETLTQKRAYMEDKELGDRPADFSWAEPVVALGPKAELAVDRGPWETRLRAVSASFEDHAHIIDSGAGLTIDVITTTMINSEGTRVREGRTVARLRISAEALADDGDTITDSRTYEAATPEELPDQDQLVADANALAAGLAQAIAADVLEDYRGPVLFDGAASARLFNDMLAGGLAGRADPVGTGRRRFGGSTNLEKQLGKAILPESFQVYDDPTVEKVGGEKLAGHYGFDGEGVPAQRTYMVVDGKLVNMAMSRTPTAKLSGSNGHGRRTARSGGMQASVANLFVESKAGKSDEELKAALLAAASEQGLDYALRVTALSGSRGGGMAAMMRGQRGGSSSSLGDPIHIFKVFVEDGHEEPVRGCEFGPFDLRDMRDILAAGSKPTVINLRGAVPTSVVAPAILVEEIELRSIEQELEKPPFIEAPHVRQEEAVPR